MNQFTMARAIHISDVHAGRQDDRIVEELLLDISHHQPDLVFAGGDFTQRSRRSQWASAAKWLDRIEAPVLAVPGNHDIPLFDFGRRVLDPFGRYRTHVGNDLEPQLVEAGVRGIGVRTADPARRAEGRVSEQSLERFAARALEDSDAQWTVLLTHHPLAAHRDVMPGTPAQGWEDALSIAASAKVDLLLSGHTHRRRSGPFTRTVGGRSMVVAHTGTACSTRQRGDEPQSWQVIDLGGDQMDLTPRIWNPDTYCFEDGDPARFNRSSSGWQQVSAGA